MGIFKESILFYPFLALIYPKNYSDRVNILDFKVNNLLQIFQHHHYFLHLIKSMNYLEIYGHYFIVNLT